MQFLLQWDKRRLARKVAEESAIGIPATITPQGYDEKAYEAENPDQKVLA